MGRPIGQRITQVRDIIKKLGPCTARQISAHMPEVDIENVHKYCSRAVGYRMANVDRTTRPKIYSLVDKFAEKVEKSQPEMKPVAENKPIEPHYLHGVWR